MSLLTDDILSRVDIVDIVSNYVKLKKTGVNYSGLCPFHNEKSPSFVVSPHKQIFKCFGCGEGGNAISFFMKIERMDFWDAVKELSQQHHIDISKYNNHKHYSVEQQSQKEKIKRMNKVCQEFFLEAYKHSDKAKKYVNTRHISDETKNNFGLGYAPANHQNLVHYLQKKGFNQQDITDSSLAKIVRNNELYTFFYDRLTIPIQDHLGNIIAFGGRTMDAAGKPKYINTSETTIYNKSKTLYGINILKQQIKKYQKIIIVEGYPDVRSLHTAGLPITVATCGTALTKDHIHILKRYSENIFLFFDNDNAGKQATLKAIKTAYTDNIFPQVVQLPEGYKDIDEYINKTKTADPNTPQDIDQQISQWSTSSLQRARKYLNTKYDKTVPSQRQQILDQLFDLVQSVESIAIQQAFLEAIAENSGSKYEIMEAEYRQFCKKIPKRQKAKQAATNSSKKRRPDDYQIIYGLMDEQLLSSLGLFDHNFFQTLNKMRTIIASNKKTKELDSIDTSPTAITEKEENTSTTLRREQELSSYESIDDKLNIIRRLTIPIINNLVMQLYKGTNLNNTTKQQILQDLQKLKNN